MPPATAGRMPAATDRWPYPNAPVQSRCRREFAPVNFELLARGPPAVSNQPTKTKPELCVAAAAHLEGVLPKSISATAERGSVSRSMFNRSKTHGISCAHSALRAAAGRRPALRYQSDLCSMDSVKMRPGCDALVAATPVFGLNPGCVSNGLPLGCRCELCENVNNFSSKKFLPVTAFREKIHWS